jgi:hypothetical protein
MKKLLVSLLGILAFGGAACEQHSAEELRRAHGKHAHPEVTAHPTEQTEATPAPFTPDTIPQNPAGAGPVGEYEAAKPEKNEAPKFFPKK